MSKSIQPVYVPGAHASALARAERKKSARGAGWYAVLAQLFVAVVAVPTLLSAFYYLFLAAPQYQATVRMAVFAASGDAGETTSVLSDSIGGGDRDTKPGDLSEIASNHSAAKRIVGQAEQLMSSTLGRAGDGRDPFIVAAYIRSLAIIGDLNHDGWLTHVFADELADPLARMDSDASREVLWRTFNRHVDARVDSLSGLITVNARTFSPEISKELVSRIVNASERLVNETRARSLSDATSTAEATLQRAETRYLDALARVRQLRESVGVIDPGQGAMALAKALTELKVIKATLEMQYYGMNASVTADSPMARALAARIAATDKEISELEMDIASTDATSSAVATYLAQFEVLETERLLSQAAYQQAVASADRAQSQADRQVVYLVEFEPPNTPEESRYPRGWRIVLTVFICASALWSVVGLIGAGIRNQMS